MNNKNNNNELINNDTDIQTLDYLISNNKGESNTETINKQHDNTESISDNTENNNNITNFAFESNNSNTENQENKTSKQENNLQMDEEKITNQGESNTIDNNQSEQNADNNTENNDEELLKSFIGKNYEKITTKSFNIPGFFFTSFYMFYRKMLVFGLIVSIITILLTSFINTNNEILNIVLNIIVIILIGINVSVFVNDIYINNAKKKIKKIKEKNKEKSFEEIKSICIKKGGTSIGQIFLGFFIIIITIFIIILLLPLFGYQTIFNNNDNDYTNNEEYNNNNSNNYNGNLTFDSEINMKDEFTIEVPSNFTNESDDSSYTYKYNGEEGMFNECKFNFIVPIGYNNAESLINGIADYNINNNPTEVNKTTINNIDWYNFSFNDTFGKTYYYGTTKNNKAFLLIYDINEDADSDCESHLEKILNSIQSK